MTSADPRLKNSGKRPASRSPDGNNNVSSSTNKRHTGPLRVSSSYQATNNLDATTARSPGNASDVSASASASASASMAVIEGFFKATTTAAELSIELKAAQTAYTTADREFRNMQDKFDRFPAIRDQKKHARDRAQQRLVRIQRQLEEQKPLQTQVCATLASLLDSRGSDHAAVALTKRVHALESPAPALEAGISRRLDDIESRIKEIADDGIADKEDIIKDVDGLGDRVEAIARDSVVLRKDIDDQLSSNKIRFADVKEDTAELRRAITDQLAKATDATKILDHNAEAINECMGRLQKVEAAAWSESSLNSVQQTVSSLQGKLQALENVRPASAAPPGAAGKSVWQTVLPENDPDGSDEPQNNNIGSLGAAGGPSAARTYTLNEIEMLKSITVQHTRFINNFTTDEIVKQMVDQMSNMYPDARNTQQAMTQIRSDFQNTQDRLLTLATTLSQLSQTLFPTVQAKMEAYIHDLQINHADLLQRVEQHETTLQAGREQLTKLDGLEGTVRVLVDGAATIREHLKKIPELQLMVLKLEEAVKAAGRKREGGGGGGGGGGVDGAEDCNGHL